ncbi:uncharacterized protein LOC126576874 [Anopheles aquasalis]|uniref:uncharacterized protein LOC126576874 n=1 Tax=Anopheles aquasalis TaxID=42839 RepID=UPI00215AC0D0|nr:uncharacterized protein LOC126576874 [Anopheles aquasalis]
MFFLFLSLFFSRFLLQVLTLASTLLSIQCRPQTIQIEKQVIRLAVPAERSGRTLGEAQFLAGDTRRGSIEETDRILREIERINVAMGYKKKAEVAFPRGQGAVAGYFYPRPAYYPPSLAQVKQQPALAISSGTSKASKGIAKPIIDPFRAQSFFYPAPYLQLPTLASPRAFQLVPLVPVATPTMTVPAVRASKDLRSGVSGSDQIYILPISVPSADGKSSEIRYIPSTVNFGSFSAVQLRGKALKLQQEDGEKQEKPVASSKVQNSKPKKAKGVMDDVEEVADAVQSTKLEEELLEEIVEAVDYDEEDEERLGGQRPVAGDTTELPAITNDKFMGGPEKQKVNAEEEDEEDEESDEETEPDIELQVQMLQKSGAGHGKSFNITNVFNNFTHRFSILPTTPATTLTELPLDELDLKEKPLSTGPGADEELPAQDKGPFGFLATKQADPSGTGVVIQRLRVRQGGIAIAGPGGVATAGSGGTAIVGPNGTAITHPRSLTIAGPGAKIYAVPESVDLAKTVQAQQRSLPLDAAYLVQPDSGSPLAPALVPITGTTKVAGPVATNDKQVPVRPLKLKKPKRVQMSAPLLQALQLPDGQFTVQRYEQPTPVMQQQQQQKKKKKQSAKVVVTATGSTTADAPAGRVPVAPTVDEYYPFYGLPMTDRREEASLILEPSSKAISGNGGTAISTPVSHAILKQGSTAKILFRPQSVAIVGANGRAHAQADLIVDYVNPEHRAGTTDVLKLPFYGGARGQILEIRKNSDGTVVSKILRGDDLEEEMELKVQQVADETPTTKAPPVVKATTASVLDTDESEYQGSEEDTKSSSSSGEQSFGDYLLRIQNAAASLVSLQETVKKTGKLSPDQKKVYAENLEKLGVAAQKLAHIQQADDDQDAIRFLFDLSALTASYETPVSSSSSASASPASEKKKTTSSSSSKLTSFPGYKGKDDKDKKKKEEEENVGEDGSGGGDSVQVETQEKESSIAEAKPVGLAIAGEGGVASSKPVATAVVGDGGLAVARPVATAIAGIKPSELGSLGLPISVNKKVLSRGKYGLITSSDDVMGGGLLVGPDYEARVAPKEIEAEIDDNRQQQQQQQQQLMANFDTEKFLANLRLKTQPTTSGAIIASVPQTYAAYQPQSYLQQQQQHWSPSFYQYQPNPYNSPLAYAQQLDALTQSQYNPYYLAAATASAYQQPSVAAAAAYQQPSAATQNPFQAYEYPQRAALYTPAPVLSPAATAYSNFNNYPSFSTPSPYRFFYY